MQGIKRRVVYITLYEGIAIVAASVGLTLMSGKGLGHSGALAVVASVIAVLWNLAFNALFERWEARQSVRGRSVKRRIAHAVGFEGGLIAFLVPVFAWALGVSLLEALVMDLGLVVFFLVYTFVFNWGFDTVFGLPTSAATPSTSAAQPA
ncbi:PACE efflux transporter [Variovorax sp. PAMC28562]|uniref:PACE efflux transporter n=1 Tax=Variovorax sp. PAMC28562 TaxID=2762323 RepID=UPI00164E2A4A|nr:PACE efflux transporter [Variovorax sp. PAMC28562]QNK74827.1 PACE efflux transporter [Variovorax sp. PAMC28562]